MAELLDVLDKYGQPTGEVAPRNEVHAQGLWHRSVHVWIINSRYEVLVQLRSLEKDDRPGEWDMVSGGHLQAGQSAIDGAIRELQEELGVAIQPDQFEFLFENVQQVTRPGYVNNEFNPIMLLTTDRTIDEFTFNDGEVTALQWIPLDQLEAMMHAGQVIVRNTAEARVLNLLRERFGQNVSTTGSRTSKL